VADERDPGRPGDPPARTVTVELDWRTVVWAVAAVVAVGFVATVVVIASTEVLLIVVAVFVALALDPVVCALQRWRPAGRRIGRGTAVSTVGLALVLGIAAFGALAGPQLVRETRSLGTDLPDTARSLTDLPLVGGWFREVDAPGRVSEFLASIPEKLRSTDADLTRFAKDIGVGVGVTLLTLVLVLAVLYDGPRLVSQVRRTAPPEGRPRLDVVGRLVYEVVARYFAGSLLIALINGVWVTSFALVAGVPLSPVLGVWAAVTSLIPQIGGLLGFALVALVSLTAGIVPGLVMIVSFLVIMLATNHLLQPTIVGRAVSLSAPVTMLATIVGLTVASIPGALFAVPTTGAVKAIVQHFRGIDPQPRPEHLGVVDRLRRRWRAHHPVE
jgi:predicted PurR-regulated permease PerM